VPNILVTGKKIDSMDMESRLGLITRDMKATTSLARNTILEHSNGQMVRHTLENSITIIFTVKVFTLGRTIESMRATGELTKCMVKEHSHGPTDENMLENTPMTRKKGMVSLSGPMEGAIEASGKEENSMAREHTLLVLVKKSTANGKKERELDGLGGMNKIES